MFRPIPMVATLLSAPFPARAATREDTCDRIAAHPLDRDRPAGVKGSADIEKKDIDAGIAACTAATAQPNASRRFTFQLGRIREFGRAYADAADDYRTARTPAARPRWSALARCTSTAPV